MTALSQETLTELRRLLTDARGLDETCNPLDYIPAACADEQMEPWEVVRYHTLCRMASQADEALHAALDYDTIEALLRAAEGTTQAPISTPPEDTTP